MKPLTALILLLTTTLFPSTPVATTPATGLDGYGLDPTGDYCVWACYWVLNLIGLECSAPGGLGGLYPTWITSPECHASDAPFLTTFAWCLRERCTHLKLWELEARWDGSVGPGSIGVPGAMWSYAETVSKVLEQGPPTRDVPGPDGILNYTGVVPYQSWLKYYNGVWGIEREQWASATYGIVVLVAGFGMPIILTWLGYLPYMSRVLAYLNPRLLYPSTIGRYNVAPLPYLIGNAPTLGQTLAITAFVLLNVLVCCVDYKSFQPQHLRPDLSVEIGVYVLYRTGVIAFALLPLLILFASRNNVLLYVTDWSHATYLLLHRWVARLFCIHSLVHTIVAIPNFYATDGQKPYWIWGAVAAVAMAIMLLTSILWVRRQWYEFFLAVHIVLAVITVVGCWYHVVLWIGMGTYGYETWLYVACAVWFFDRVARAARVIKNGGLGRRSRIVELDGPDGEYVRIDIPGLRWGTGDPGMHIYAYFPTLSLWRQPWENHPFSVVPTALLHKKGGKSTGSGAESPNTTASGKTPSVVEDRIDDAEKGGDLRLRVSASAAAAAAAPLDTTGVTLLIKKGTGVTKHLYATNRMLTFVDGPYGNSPTGELRRCDRLLLIAGGVGITSVLPWILNHTNVKVCWSLRESARCLVGEVDELLSRAAERDVRVGSRLDFDDLLANEVAAGWKKVGVVVSGPGGLCDDVRAAVVEAGRKGLTVFELEVDAYTW